MLVAAAPSLTLRFAPRPSLDRPVAAPCPVAAPPRPAICGVDPEDEDLGDEEDLAASEPLADEESNFDDFDDEFDDDFEEEENDPDWDHPEESEAEEPPPGKGGGRKK